MGSLKGTYTYNALEQLAIRVTTNQSPAGTTHFIHDLSGNVIAETDGMGASNTVREYVWLPETEISPTMGSRAQVDRPLAVVDGVNTTPVTWYVHADHLNRPIKMTDGAKAAVWTAVWAPWGAPHAITGTATLDARFPGQWYQMEAGLHYNWHRHYDPTLGRYTQTDPLGFVDGPSVYGYADGDSVVFVDKDGRVIVRIIIGAAIGAGIEYFTNPDANWCDYLSAGAAGAITIVAGPPAFKFLFDKGGFLNTGGKWLRIGNSFKRADGTNYFSVRGKAVDKITGKKGKHWDIFKWPF